MIHLDYTCPRNAKLKTRNVSGPETISGSESQTGFSEAIFSTTSDPILVKISRLDSPRLGLSNGD